MKDSRVVTALKNKAAFSHGSGENCYGGRWGRKLMKVSSFMEEKKNKTYQAAAAVVARYRIRVEILVFCI